MQVLGRRALVVCALAALFFSRGIALPQPVAAAQSAKQVFDYIYVIDTSGSMVGKGDGSPAVIMPKVKDAVAAQISGIENGATVVVMPFNQGVKSARTFVLNGPGDRSAAVEFVKALDANGSSTWIYRSLLDALDTAKTLASTGGSHTQTVLLYTDGLDNEPGRQHTFSAVAKQFGLQRGEADNLWLKYVTLGIEPPAADKQIISQTPGMELQTNPKGQVKTLRNVEVRPYLLDFGNMRSRSESAVTLRLSFDKGATGLPFAVSMNSDSLEKIGVLPVATVSSDKLTDSVVVVLKLENRASLDSAGDAKYEGLLTFRSDSGLQFVPPTLPFVFRVKDEPIVEIQPENRTDALPSFGTLKRTSSAVTPASKRWIVRWSSPKDGATVTLRAWPDAPNPSALSGDQLRLVTSSGKVGSTVSITPSDKWVELRLAPGGLAPEGKYGVRLIAAAQNATVVLTGAAASTPSGELSLPLDFTLPGIPMSPLKWLGIVSAALVLVLLLAFATFCAITGQGPERAWRDLAYMSGVKKPTFSMEQLVIREPKSEAGRSFPLEGRSEVLIGSGGEFLGELPESFRIKALWRQQRLRAQVVAVEGDVRHQQSGDSFDVPFASVDVAHGDTLHLGKYVIGFESGDIT